MTTGKKTAPKPKAAKPKAAGNEAANKPSSKAKTTKSAAAKDAPPKRKTTAASGKAALKKTAKKAPEPKTAVKAKSAAKPAAPKSKKESQKKSPALCIFDLYNLKFGMSRETVAEAFDFAESGHIHEKAVLKAGADTIQVFFDHMGRLWQVKAYYSIKSQSEAEGLLERMSKDYRFQTPTSRVAFELDEKEDGTFTMYIRYTEINIKRSYIHHMMAEGAAKLARIEEEEAKKRMVEELEDEEYIPTGPMMF